MTAPPRVWAYISGLLTGAMIGLLIAAYAVDDAADELDRQAEEEESRETTPVD